MQSGKANINIDVLGERNSPVLTIDDFSGGIETVRKHAGACTNYAPDQMTKYPGVRLPLPRDYIIASLKPLLPYIHKIFKIPEHLTPNPHGSYSLVTSMPEALSPWQTVPHFDNTSPYMIALIHYLNEGPHGGTGFFRHRPTGYDCIDESRKDHFLDSVSQFLSFDSGPPGYCDTNHPEFELYHTVDYKANRMLIFRGYMLHSGLVQQDADISSDPAAGRLTANMFVNFG